MIQKHHDAFRDFFWPVALDSKYDLNFTRSKCTVIKNAKTSTTPTETTHENRESKTKKNIKDFTPNPMPADVAVAKERLDPGKPYQ